ncbi:MAG: hypothetical protein J6X02_02525 [Bacilli bacterium]|nr:hypothetical protein [Bacilli bacterium]
MTYYELVNFLYGLIDTPIEYKNIEFLNSVNITLEGERYQRFLDQLAIVVSERMSHVINNLKDKLVSEYLDANTLIIETSNLANEMKYCKSLCNTLLVKPENQKEFNTSIVDTNNKLVDAVLEFFNDEERKDIVKRLYMKEEETEIR